MDNLFLKRRSLFFALASHPLRGKEFGEFNLRELEYATEVISEHAHESKDQYVQFLNRLHIKDERVRPTKRTKLWGCLLEAATAETADGRLPRPTLYADKNVTLACLEDMMREHDWLFDYSDDHLAWGKGSHADFKIMRTILALNLPMSTIAELIQKHCPERERARWLSNFNAFCNRVGRQVAGISTREEI